MQVPYDVDGNIGIAYFQYMYEKDDYGNWTGNGSWQFIGTSGDNPFGSTESTSYDYPTNWWGYDSGSPEDYDPETDPYYYSDPYDQYYTGASPPTSIPGASPPGDKVPAVVACDAAATADGVNVNAVYNGIKSNTNFTDMLTKTTNAGESGMSITKTANGTYDDLGYVNGTSGNSVIVSTSNPFFNIIAGGHTHPPGKNDGPSPGDIYHLLQGKLGNDNYNTDFVFAANGKQYAITISDKAAALKFLVDYPPSTNLNGADWSGTPNDNSLYSNFLSYERTLRAEGYPQEMWEEYGLVYLMSDPKYNMGIKLLQNVNGIFKELNVNLYRDAAGKGHFGIKICQ